jgi:hypothetical protein
MYPGGEQVDGDHDQYDVNGYNVENQGDYWAESAFRVGGGTSIITAPPVPPNPSPNPGLYAWRAGIQLDTSAEAGISFRSKTATLAAPVLFGIGIDMSHSSFNTCGILLANGASSGIQGSNAAVDNNYRLIDIDASNNVVIGAASAVVQGAPPSALADARLNNSNISFYLDESGNNLMVKVKYSGGTVKTGTVCSVS